MFHRQGAANGKAPFPVAEFGAGNLEEEGAC